MQQPNIYNFSYFCTKFDQIWLASCWELNGCPIQARYLFMVSNSNLALVLKTGDAEKLFFHQNAVFFNPNFEIRKMASSAEKKSG